MLPEYAGMELGRLKLELKLGRDVGRNRRRDGSNNSKAKENVGTLLNEQGTSDRRQGKGWGT